jgi:hypothetical protein
MRIQTALETLQSGAKSRRQNLQPLSDSFMRENALIASCD